MSRPRLARASRLAPLIPLLLVPLLATGSIPTPSRQAAGWPNVLLVTVDTLRADRLSSYGYSRPTSPNIDRLLQGGVTFREARVVEPLTAPALCSMITSLYPHEHGASRNGLRMRAELDSLPKTLEQQGYRTVAFVGNWTLRDKLSGLGEHFQEYREVLTKKRWLGFLRSEATANDLTDLSIDWLQDHVAVRPDRPFLLWVHYVEPHAPYKLQREHLEQLGLGQAKKLPPSDRYDTEIAFVDAAIGRLLGELDRLELTDDTLVVFTSDHGESLGEHGYWGHGRHLYEPSLRVPMGLRWPGRIEPRVVESAALNIDLASTVLGLLDLPVPAGFRGQDWAAVLDGLEPAPDQRVGYFQAHKGAVISKHRSELARRSGLLAVGLVAGGRKEVFRIPTGRRQVFDLLQDPRETRRHPQAGSDPTPGLRGWMQSVYSGLALNDAQPPAPLDDESIEQLRALGYVN